MPPHLSTRLNRFLRRDFSPRHLCDPVGVIVPDPPTIGTAGAKRPGDGRVFAGRVARSPPEG